MRTLFTLLLLPAFAVADSLPQAPPPPQAPPIDERVLALEEKAAELEQRVADLETAKVQIRDPEGDPIVPMPPKPPGDGWEFDPAIAGKNGATGWYRLSQARPTSPAPAVSYVTEPVNHATSLPAGWHSHQCPSCATVWSHDGGPGSSHNCPNCGTYQNVIYRGGAPSVPSVRPTVARPSRFLIAPSVFGGGCANGNCARPW